MAHRDACLIGDRISPGVAVRDELWWLADVTDAIRSTPGLVQLMPCEAAVPRHPVRGYFTRRLERLRRYFIGLLERFEAASALQPGLTQSGRQPEVRASLIHSPH